jgi:heptosyltransferase-2
LKKILIIQTAFIGDVVLATGILEKLHMKYPDAKMDFLVRKGNESLFVKHPFLNKILVWNKNKNKYKNLFQLLLQIRSTGYDAVINVQRFAATGLLTAFSKASIKIGFDKNPLSFLFTHIVKHVVSNADNPLHEAERNQLLIASLAKGAACMPKLYPSVEDEASVENYAASPFICIAPASIWFTKKYPANKWIELINELLDVKIYLIGSYTDIELCNSIINQSGHKNIVNLAGQLSFLQSAALMKRAAMNYVNDSAPMHFASAVNAPVTAVYCSTIPSFGFAPLSTKSFVVESLKPLACKPCGLHGLKACPEKHFNCANQIEVQQLLNTMKS